MSSECRPTDDEIYFFLDIIIGCEKWEYKEQAFFGHKSTQLYSKFMQILCCIWQIISAVDTEKNKHHQADEMSQSRRSVDFNFQTIR